MTYWRTALFTFIIGVLCGIVVMGYLRRPKPVKPDQAAPEVHLPGGRIELEVKPPVRELPHVDGLPVNHDTVGHIEIDVVPDVPVRPPGDTTPVIAQPPIKVFMDLVRLPDGHMRVVAYAEGGKVVGGMDIRVESQPITAPAKVMPEYRWSVMAEHITPLTNSQPSTWGAMVTYSRGPFVVGAGGNRYEGRVAVGMRF